MPRESPIPEGRMPEPGKVLDRSIYRELHALAADFLGRERSDHTLQSTALVHEAWIRLSAQDASRWTDRAHFFAIASQAMRRILVDHARRKQSEKRNGGRQRVTLVTDVEPPNASDGIDVIALDDALRRLAELDERQARIVELRFFSGLTVDEVARALGVSAGTIAGEWRLARAWLSRELTGGDVG